MPAPREIWAAGDWPPLSKLVVIPGEATAAAAAVGPGDKALDVGAGDGNVAIPLAKAGAQVTALDPTPELFDWDLEGMNGQLFAVMAPYMPPPPDGAQPPPLWGVEDHIRECLAPTGRDVTIGRDTAPTGTFASVDDYTDFLLRVLGPVDLARPQLEADGRWDDMRAAVRASYERYNEATDGTFRASPTYFRISA